MLTYIIAGVAVLGIVGFLVYKKRKDNDKKVQPIPADGKVVRNLVRFACGDKTDYFYYAKEADTRTYLSDTKDSIKYWDNRYATISSISKCREQSAQHNLYMIVDDGSSTFSFGGPQSTLLHKFDKKVYPWIDGASLMLQATINELTFTIRKDDPSGGICFNFFITNHRTQERINFVINTCSFGHAWTEEQSKILFDPTTNTKFVSTVVKDSSKWITKSPVSSSLKHVTENTVDFNEHFYRVNVTNKDLMEVLAAAGYHNNTNEWYLNFIGIQTEIEETSGKCELGLGFKDFSAYIATGAM